MEFEFFYLILPAPGVHAASDRNEYQKMFLGGGGGKARLARKTDNLTAICEPIV
jgi:hypothetical protein